MTHYTDYAFTLSVPGHIAEEIDRYKRASARVVGIFEGMHTKAGIDLLSLYRQKPFLAQQFLLQMEQRLISMPPVMLSFNNFSYHRHDADARTIFVAHQDTPSAAAWFKQLKTLMGLKVKTITPQLTIAKNLQLDEFDKLWPYILKCNYKTSFLCDRLTILERDTYHEQAAWKIYKEFYFGVKPEN